MRMAKTVEEDALRRVSPADPEAAPSGSAGTRGFLRIDGLTKRYGRMAAVDRLDLSVDEGELVAFLGPSGCGKTTTLRMIAGFIDGDDGAIYVDGTRIDTLPARARGTAMVFQDYALFPHLSAYDNIAFGLKMRKVKRAELRRRVQDVLDFVQLGGIGGKYPRELSGGMQQRVALARAIVVEPRILLLDEPLSNLDAKLRKQLRVELRDLHERIGITTVFVTHDLEEAFHLADRVAVMNGGHLEQFGTPEEIYAEPASPFVADFVGHTNVIRGELRRDGPGRHRFRGGGIEVATQAPPQAGDTGVYTVPPHRLRLSTAEDGPVADNVLRGSVHMVTYLGAAYSVLVDVGELRLQCDIPSGDGGMTGVREGRSVWLSWDVGEGTYVPDR